MCERVIYFSRNDLCYAMNLDRIETIEVPDSINAITINDAIEFYEIKRYIIDDEVYLKTWSKEEVELYKAKSYQLLKLTNLFFNLINDDSVVSQFSVVDSCYRKEFWNLFDINNLSDKISDEVFFLLIISDGACLLDILIYKKISNRYGRIIKKYVLQNYEIINVLLFSYGQNNGKNVPVFIPIEVTSDDVNSILEKYIETGNPNRNTLELIYTVKKLGRYMISDKIRLKARLEFDKKTKEIFSFEKSNFECNIHLEFSPNICKEKLISFSDDTFSVVFNSKWLEETLDYPSIMNNFIYLFEFVDSPQMRSLVVSKKHDLNIIDKIRSFSDSPRLYLDSLNFKFNNYLLLIQLEAYYHFLKQHQIDLEDVLKWVFTEYFQKEFLFPEMRVVFPSKQTTYVEKCVSLLTIFDSLIKQYSLYAENGEINFDLINISTTPISFSSVPSIVKEKYLYGDGNDYKSSTYLLFSDQCLLSYLKRIAEGKKKQYDSFFDLLRSEKVFSSDYADCYTKELEYLKKRNLIRILDDGRIVFNDYDQVLVLRDLYLNDVISIHHYPKRFSSVFKEMEGQKIVFLKDTLFSTPESQYLDFLLNRSKFDNGPEIRNQYVHGNQQSNTDENSHYKNYLIIISLFILLAIKINDELCIKNPELSHRT